MTAINHRVEYLLHIDSKIMHTKCIKYSKCLIFILFILLFPGSRRLEVDRPPTRSGKKPEADCKLLKFVIVNTFYSADWQEIKKYQYY